MRKQTRDEKLFQFEAWLNIKTPPFHSRLIHEYRFVVPEKLRIYGFNFLPKKYWRPDYCWLPDYKLIVEIEGGAFKEGGGGHNRGGGYRKDIVRYNTFIEAGFTLYRFMYEMLPPKSSYAIDMIEAFFNKQFGF